MPERDPIDLFKEQLNKTDALAGLHADHEDFKQWYSETRTLLEKAFSSKSVHYQNFLALRFREISVKSFASPEIDKINAGRYKRDLDHAKTTLHGAIKELTLDRTLFKKIPSTPKTVEFSLRGECFVSSGILEPEIIQAIDLAFEGTGLTLIYGSQDTGKEETLRQKIDQIRRAKMGIYDLSVQDKTRSLIELGAAIGMGKEVILIHIKGSSLPECIQPLDRVEYENANDLAEKLKKKFR